MSGHFPNSSKASVRYKNIVNVSGDEQVGEILISSSKEEERNSDEEKRIFPKLKICFYTFIILIFLLICILLMCDKYFFKNNLVQPGFESENKLNDSKSCVPLRRVKNVILLVEKTDLASCSDNKTCHSLLEDIEQKHDGLKNNFVIGETGELYIGSGFKCLVESEENALIVKLLEPEQGWSFENYLEVCYRLSDIIEHGTSCNKISPDYIFYFRSNYTLGCTVLLSGKTRKHHIHDPEQELKLIDDEFRWSTCENLSSTINFKTENDKVITLESLPKKSCLPLELVDKITVDVVEAQPFDCSDEHSCLQAFEEYKDTSQYNFIIGHNQDVYVSLGFKCRAENTSGNVLKVKVLQDPDSYSYYTEVHEIRKLSQILYEGFMCVNISRQFSIKVNNCINTSYTECANHYKEFGYKNLTNYWVMSGFFYNEEYFNISSEDSRGIVPRGFRYNFCTKNNSTNTTLVTEPTLNTDNTSKYPIKASCIPLKKGYSVSTVQVGHGTISKSLYREIRQRGHLCSKTGNLGFWSCLNIKKEIEREHDAVDYNFVIGPEGELYIGSGFKCLLDDDSALHVKILEYPASSEDKPPVDVLCSRLSEIIHEGLSCGKISQSYDVLWLDEQICDSYDASKNRSHHIHDPNQNILQTLIPSYSKWTVCEGFSNITHDEKGKLSTLKSFPKKSCLPLQNVDKVTVDIVITPSVECFDDLSCMNMFEENHDGFKYNFILGHNQDLYVGLGFKCKSEETAGDKLKIKVLIPTGNTAMYTILVTDVESKFLQIIEEGLACGIITEEFSLDTNCNVREKEDRFIGILCTFFEISDFRNIEDIHYLPWLKVDEEHYNISSEHGRGIVPRTHRYQFCQRNHQHETSTRDIAELMDSTSTRPGIESDYDYETLQEDPDPNELSDDYHLVGGHMTTYG